MWATRGEPFDGGRGRRFTVEFDGRSVPFAEVLRSWRDDAAFRSWFSRTLSGSPFAAFRWETPPVTASTLDRTFEFVLWDSPGLAKRPDGSAFAKQWSGGSGADVAVFANLGGDAILVVPCPIAAPSAYGHLAAFVREAPDKQRHALWRSVGTAMAGRVGSRPVWLSTAGAGVPWLHVRLDDRPKYYDFGPYRKPPPPDVTADPDPNDA